MLLFFPITAILVPVFQQLLLSAKHRRPGTIAFMMYLPGCFFVLWLIPVVVLDGGGTEYPYMRAVYAYMLTGPRIFFALGTIFAVTGMYTVLFEVLRRICAKDWEKLENPKLTPGVYKPLTVIFLLLVLVGAYAANYTSLEDAVRENDLNLARRRLEFNLAGLDPNNGRIDDMGTAGIHLFPLLPVAVKNGSVEMAALLVRSGAELNPKSRQPRMAHGANPEWNMLYYATINDDMEMLEFLIQQGADPTRNIAPVVSEKNIDQLSYLLSHGADVDAVRDELKSQRLDMVLQNMLDELSDRNFKK